jgi:hypothetical protein
MWISTRGGRYVYMLISAKYFTTARKGGKVHIRAHKGGQGFVNSEWDSNHVKTFYGRWYLALLSIIFLKNRQIPASCILFLFFDCSSRSNFLNTLLIPKQMIFFFHQSPVHKKCVKFILQNLMGKLKKKIIQILTDIIT